MINSPLGDCKTAELHLADRIQAGGVLVVADADSGLIRAVSGNSAELLDQPPEALLGTDWRRFQEPMPIRVNPQAPVAGVRLDLIDLGGRRLQVAHHRSGAHLIFELMPAPKRDEALEREDEAAELSSSIAEFSGIDDEVETAAALMRAVARITGYDRVMVYRFLPDWHGEVVAEALAPGVEGFLGLRFPAGDIPPNARRLYLVKRQRVVPSISDESVPVLADQPGLAVDLTWSELRAVHPVHLQYLRNMGVEASFSVSIVVAGRLWGLIACHHFAPRALSFRRRRLCEQLAGIASMHMLALRQIARQADRYRHETARGRIASALDTTEDCATVLPEQLAALCHTFGAQAALACLGEQEHAVGPLPDPIALGALRAWLDGGERRLVSAYDRVPAELAHHAGLVRHASGLLHLPLGDQGFLLLMRVEQSQQVRWAGRPRDENADPALQLTPRSSFEAWKEQTHGQAPPWSDADLEAAAALRELLVSACERSQLQRLALTDALTGLANRTRFDRQLQESIAASLRGIGATAVLMIDLDRFKQVNDQLGHAAGDDLLIQVAQRLRAQVREHDLVARLGGDEFAILQTRVTDEQAVRTAGERLIQALSAPYEVMGQPVEIGASIGAALCPLHTSDADELVHFADMALYGVKRAGRNAFGLFDPRTSVGAQGESAPAGEFARALTSNALHLVYQPVVDLRSSQPRAIECYARWQHPVRGLLTGHALLALASRHGLEAEFAHWGIASAVHQALAWQSQGLPRLPIAVNISATQFLSADLADFCLRLSRERDIDLGWLRLDVDQGVLAQDVGLVGQRVNQLGALGIRVALDHFGEGSVHLGGLAGASLHRLKVRANILLRQSATSLASVLMGISAALRVPVVATHVETASSLDALRTRGVALAQGYAVAPVMDADALAQWLRRAPTDSPQR